MTNLSGLLEILSFVVIFFYFKWKGLSFLENFILWVFKFSIYLHFVSYKRKISLCR